MVKIEVLVIVIMEDDFVLLVWEHVGILEEGYFREEYLPVQEITDMEDGRNRRPP